MTFDQRLGNAVNLWGEATPLLKDALPDGGQDDLSDEARLVRQAVSGDRTAFSTLVAANYQFIYRTAFKWCGHQSDAEDVAQDVCVKLAGALARFDGRSAFRSWVYRITLNAVRDMQRTRARSRNRHAAMTAFSPMESPADQEDAATEAELWRAVRNLPDKQRDAVLLTYSEDLTHGAAAEILDVKESTVSWYIHEARKTLKGLL